MAGRRAPRRQRRVPAEQAGPVPAQPQQGGRQCELLLRLPERGRPRVQPGQRLPGEERRAPVVRVHQGPVLRLGALVHLRDPRHRQVQQRHPQDIGPGRLRHLGREVPGGRDVRRDRGLVRRVLLGPAGPQRGLADGLQQGLREAPGALGDLPEAERRLPGHPGELGVRPGGPAHQPGGLRQRRDPGPDVGTALGVVRGEHRPGAGPVPFERGAVRVELGRVDRRLPRIAADLGGRQQRRVPVEGPVLQRLGAQGRRGLREARREGRVRAHQLPYAGHRIGACPQGRLRHRLRGQAPVPGVRPVHRIGDQQLAHGRGEMRAGGPFQPPQLGGQVAGQDLPGAGPGRAPPVIGRRGGLPVVPGEFGGARRVGEHPVHLPQRVVPGGPRHRPAGRQPLPPGQDLLHHHPAAVPHRRAQPPQVPLRIGEPVHVVDPQPGGDPVPHQLQHLRVRRREHLGVLHPDPDQLRDGEEAPVVQLGTGLPPPGRPVPLRGQQLRQRQPRRPLAQRELPPAVAQDVPVDRARGRIERVREHGQQQPAVARLPVDVEPARVRRPRPPAQDLPQGQVQPQRGRYRHVVRHDVQHQAEPAAAGGGGQRPQPRLAAELGPHPGVVGDVVPVSRARNRLQYGGKVQVGDAERGQVRYGRLGRGERELRPQLEPVGRGGCRRRCRGGCRRRCRGGCRGRCRGGDSFQNIRFRFHVRATPAHENVRTHLPGFRVMTQCVRVTALR